MAGAEFFDSRSERYAQARPPYPGALWERLAQLGLLRPRARVLELGAGTGLATGPLLTAGARVTAVEPGPQLAARLVRRWPAADVRVSRAEDVELGAGTYDWVAIATAVHWLDLDVLLPRMHRWLLPGGHLAVWRHAFGDPTVEPTPFRRRVLAITSRRSAPPRPGPDELDTPGWASRLAAGGWFAPVGTQEIRWTTALTAEQVQDLFSTFSDWSADEVDEAVAAVRDLGGTVVEHYVCPLVVLRARPLSR